MNSALNRLIVTEWTPESQNERTFPTTGTTLTPPVATDAGQAHRFARVQAHGADLVVYHVKNGGSAPTIGTGGYRVFAGTAETLQLSVNCTLVVAGVAAPTTGAVSWGR